MNYSRDSFCPSYKKNIAPGQLLEICVVRSLAFGGIINDHAVTSLLQAEVNLQSTTSRQRSSVTTCSRKSYKSDFKGLRTLSFNPNFAESSLKNEMTTNKQQQALQTMALGMFDMFARVIIAIVVIWRGESMNTEPQYRSL